MLKIATWVEVPVRLEGLQPAMLIGAQIVAGVLASYGLDAYITSATDGKHMSGSKHHCGYAIDFSVASILAMHDTLQPLLRDLKEALGGEFDVVLNDVKKIVHVEYDPD